jgi:DNA repair protein RecN (Recombination protein N)
MLRLLEVQNLALIDNLSFYPGEGLNVITGETGAGKSMLLGAVSLLLGERANPESIRAGEEAAFMQAVFTVQAELFDDVNNEDGELALCREIRDGGPNLCRVNGRVQPLSAMAALGTRLVDLHGQNKQQSLLDPETQRKLLDAYGGEKILSLSRDTERLYRKLASLRRELEALGGDDAARERHADFLRFQLDEIDSAALFMQEEEELEKQFRRLSNARQLGEITAKIYAELYDGSYDGAIVDRLGVVEKELASAAVMDEDLDGLLDRVVAVTVQLTEAARELHNYNDNINLDEAELQNVSQRLETYRRIKKKYGPSIEDVDNLAHSMRTELAELFGRTEKITQLEQEIKQTDKALRQTAGKFSSKRCETAKRLGAKIDEALQSLALQGAKLEISVQAGETCGVHGCDRVEFVFSANPGEPLRALSKTASGGEISRVMLAIKSVLAEQDTVPTLIFDEIDAGIGGLTVRAVAERLKALAKHRQVICVTHQPLIAAAANHHFAIYKETAKKRTVTRLRKLKESERETELARMLGGEEGVALTHARQLLTPKD